MKLNALNAIMIPSYGIKHIARTNVSVSEGKKLLVLGNIWRTN